MIKVRTANERGHFDHGWLQTFHTFSFAAYQDPNHMGFRSLRVINEDDIAPGQGFETHGHKDMEILTYVAGGALEHKDSMGNGSIISQREFQRMTAGTGVQHSEFNPSPTEKAHILQIWILPEKSGLPPGYEQKIFSTDRTTRLVASPDGHDGSLTIRQDVRIYHLFPSSEAFVYDMPKSRGAWVQVVRGSMNINDTPLNEGDGCGVTDETVLRITGETGSEALFFDLA